MIAHIVLFTPRAELPEVERDAFVASFRTALEAIPAIKSARVGRRRTLGRYYDRHNALDFSFVAVLEFESEADLIAYLDHPAHVDLGTRFYVTSESALAYDFEMFDGSRLGEVVAGV